MSANHRLQPLKVEIFCGMVFGTFADEPGPVETYLGPEMAQFIKRNLGRPLRVLGTHSQIIHNNWKLYAENLRDSYHATLLHTFYTTFKVNRLDMDGGIILSDESGITSASRGAPTCRRPRSTAVAGPFGQLRLSARRARPAEVLERVRRRHHPQHPDDFSEPVCPIHVELAGDPLLRAARRG